MRAMNVVGKDTADEAANEVVSRDNSNNNNSSFLLPPQSSLAFLESLTVPLVQEVVISADIGCIECQKRISNVMSRFNGLYMGRFDIGFGYSCVEHILSWTINLYLCWEDLRRELTSIKIHGNKFNRNGIRGGEFVREEGGSHL